MNKRTHKLMSSVCKTLNSTLFCALMMISSIAFADTITWTGNEDGEWSNPDNWDLNRIPAGGDRLVFPAVAPNKTQNAITVGNSSERIDLVLEGGGYVITNSAATFTFGSELISIGDNTINCIIWHQNQPAYTSTDGTLTLGGKQQTKGLSLNGNGNFVFTGDIVAGNRQLTFNSTGVTRFQNDLARFSSDGSGNALGIRMFTSGTMLVNCTQQEGTFIFGVGGDGTLGGNGTIHVATNATYVGTTGIVTLGAQANPVQPTGNGILSPGDPEVNNGIGTFTIVAQDKVIFGSDVHSSTGTLAIKIGDAGSVDLLAIDGSLDLSSTNNVLSLTAAVDVAPDDDLTFLSFTGSRTGEFSTVLLNNTDVTEKVHTGFRVGNKKFKVVYEGESDGSIKLVGVPSGTYIIIH